MPAGGIHVRRFVVALFLQAWLCRSSSPPDVHTVTINLNNNGSITAESELPKCNSGERINLLSYKYVKKDCLLEHHCSTFEESLSPVAEFLLHKMCSLKETCLHHSFISSDLETHNRNKMTVQYQCLDHFVTFLDICVNTATVIDNTVHLLYTGTSKQYQECQCSVTDGLFSLSLNDIRLWSNSEEKCSPAKLQIHLDRYTCDDKKDNYGSVFNTTFKDVMTMITILFQSGSQDLLPEMVWLIIHPQDTVKVQCTSKTWKFVPSPPYTVPSKTYIAENITGETGNKTQSVSSLPVYVIVIVVCVVIAVPALLIAFWITRKHRCLSFQMSGPRHRKNSLKIEYHVPKDTTTPPCQGDILDREDEMNDKSSEWKKKLEIISTEHCLSCDASFSSTMALTRRIKCTWCGQTFCSSCCKQTIQKSFLGTTDPATKTNTVFVCDNCFKDLTSGNTI